MEIVKNMKNLMADIILNQKEEDFKDEEGKITDEKIDAYLDKVFAHWVEK